MQAGAVVRTPSAWQALLTLIERQLRLRMKRTTFGLIWPVIGPLFLVFLYVFVFKHVFRVPIRNYPAFLFAGLLPWTFLAQSLAQTLMALSSEADLIRRTAFRYELLVFARIGSVMPYFALLLLGFATYQSATGRLAFRFLPLLVLPLAALLLLVAGLSLMLALIDVYNRDLRQVLGNVLTIWFFLAPVVYRPAMVRGSLRSFVALNPMTPIISGFRNVLFWGRPLAMREIGLELVFTGAFFAACFAIFRRYADQLPKDV